MKRNTHFIVPAAQFRLDPDSEQHVGEYTFGTHTAKHLFCKHCGICCHYVPRSNPKGIAVTVHCLDLSTVTMSRSNSSTAKTGSALTRDTGIADATALSMISQTPPSVGDASLQHVANQLLQPRSTLLLSELASMHELDSGFKTRALQNSTRRVYSE